MICTSWSYGCYDCHLHHSVPEWFDIDPQRPFEDATHIGAQNEYVLAKLCLKNFTERTNRTILLRLTDPNILPKFCFLAICWVGWGAPRSSTSLNTPMVIAYRGSGIS